jgi:predicted 3-demethylubiquinone-9 3-methyltransferase (glyoxalase superfamily)
MPSSVLPFLMFQGDGAAALDLYLSVFPDAELAFVDRYGEGEAGPAGSLKMARLVLAGQAILMNDSPIKHGFTFTPAASLFVECESEDEVRRISAALKEGGAELMPVGDYGFSRLFAWVSDRYGVSWQLNYA